MTQDREPEALWFPLLQERDRKIKELKAELEGKEDAWHEVHFQLTAEIEKLKTNDTVAQEQIAAIGKEIDKLRTSNMQALEQIWNKLKLVRIQI